MRYVFGDYTLDTDRYELRRAGTPVSLGPKPFALLTYLRRAEVRLLTLTGPGGVPPAFPVALSAAVAPGHP